MESKAVTILYSFLASMVGKEIPSYMLETNVVDHGLARYGKIYTPGTYSRSFRALRNLGGGFTLDEVKFVVRELRCAELDGTVGRPYKIFTVNKVEV